MTAPAGSGASPARDDDTRLAEIAARAEAATPGPWRQYAGAEIRERSDGRSRWAISAHGPNRVDDATFIAAARSDVPWLLAEVERLRADRDAAVAALNRVRALCEPGSVKSGDAVANVIWAREVLAAADVPEAPQ